MATDLAEFVGAAIALNLLFGVPLFPAGLITAVVAFGDPRAAERAATGASSSRSPAARHHPARLPLRHAAGRRSTPATAASGFIPSFDGTDSVLLAAGILGATVMPHVIYLHSALTQSRIRPRNDAERRELLRFQRVDVIDRDGHRRRHQHVDADRRRVAVPRLGADRRRHDRGRPRRLRARSSAAARRSRSRLALLASGLVVARASAPTPARS